MRKLAMVLAGILLLPAAALAQSSIAGIVKDTSGAVLPGVTVEAASEALIERVRSSITDANGQYRIVDLRPGTYVVTFTLTGFNTIKREAVDVPSDFVVPVNADMPVGSLQETITVTGESPVVDLQSARRQRTLDSELIQSIPTVRSYSGLVRMIPSMTGGNNDVQLSPTMIVFGGRGGRANEGRVQVDEVAPADPYLGMVDAFARAVRRDENWPRPMSATLDLLSLIERIAEARE